MIEDFFLEYFGSSFEKEKVEGLEEIKYESGMYFKEENNGGYSGYYCQKAWNEERLKNDADLAVFDLLFQIDLENGADRTNILDSLCFYGAFGAVKVRANLKIEIQFHFRKQTSPKSNSRRLPEMEEVSLED